MHEVGLNAGDTLTLDTRLSPNLVATRCQYTCHMVNTKAWHHIKRRANIDGWSVRQTSTLHIRTVLIIFFTCMLKLDFSMPKVKKGRKTQQRDRSPSPAISDKLT